MREVHRYGVLQVGQIWCVVCDGQPELRFPTRGAALAATDLLRQEHHRGGDQCEVFVLDDVGRLVVTAETSAP